MKCNAWVHKVPARLKDSGKPYTKHILKMLGRVNPKEPPSEALRLSGLKDGDIEKLERCGGKLVARIEAVDESSWGDHNAALEAEFVCELCGCQFHTGLPDKYHIEEWLTGLVAGLPQPVEPGSQE